MSNLINIFKIGVFNYMIKKIRINKFTTNSLIYLGLISNKYLCFLENDMKIGESLGRKNKLLYLFDVESLDSTTYEFSSHECVSADLFKEYLHYANVENNDGQFLLKFKKLNCNEFSQIEVGSIDLSKMNYMADVPLDITLFALNERYAVATIPNYLNFGYNEIYLDSILLIDSQEKEIHQINYELSNGDSLLRLDYLLINKKEDQEYLIIKTGSIGCFEKRDVWESNQNKGLPYNPIYQLEQLICIDLDTFIDVVVNGKNIPSEYIVDSCEMDSSFLSVTQLPYQTIYTKINFQKNISEVITLNNETRIKNHECYNGIYTKIVKTKDGIFGMFEQEDTYQFIKNNDVEFRLSNDKEILFFDDDEIITYLPTENNEYLVSVYNTKTKSLISEEKCRFFMDESNKVLILVGDNKC